MAFDRTQTQHGDEQRHARDLSLEPTRPPTEVPGYEPQRFLGAGAYGEVWVAIDRNTGRQVAIKFYAHRGGLDWSLLSREVEKLALLSADRYVVQLLQVGWDADPPYYVMEYLAHGSLDDRLQQLGKIPAEDAVRIFRDVATGLSHAHGRGVLHCDLKPGNVLLDQDHHPRLADFGQSRLSHEQDPALGTLFYMAPEQADLKAVPDARWDVYALGALLYAMLTGAPPYRSSEATSAMESARDLEDRLARYRHYLATSPKPTGHREISGVDGQLAELIDRCLAVNPARRFPNPQAVLDALTARDVRRAKRPLLVLGLMGPLLLLLIMVIAANRALHTAVKASDNALTKQVVGSNRFAAYSNAAAVTSELERRFRSIERLSLDPDFQQLISDMLADELLAKITAELNNPKLTESQASTLRTIFLAHPARKAVQTKMEELFDDPLQPKVASWFFTEPGGLQMVRAPDGRSVGRNYGWRNYFQRERDDMPADWRPGPDDHILRTTLSSVFLSEASGRWIAAVSTPVYEGGPDGKFLGVIVLTDEVGSFVSLEHPATESEAIPLDHRQDQLAVLVDWRDGPNKGLILQHPLFDQLGEVPERFKELRVLPADLPLEDSPNQVNYRDPMAEDEGGEAYRGRWLAGMAPVMIRGEDSGLLVIVQESYDSAIGGSLKLLSGSLIWIGGVTVAAMFVLVTSLWFFVLRGFATTTKAIQAQATGNGTSTATRSGADVATVAQQRK
jgi:eukaryotic-like serine/threonine-protein kinase